MLRSSRDARHRVGLDAVDHGSRDRVLVAQRIEPVGWHHHAERAVAIVSLFMVDP
jgi:hypothetical protein